MTCTYSVSRGRSTSTVSVPGVSEMAFATRVSSPSDAPSSRAETMAGRSGRGRSTRTTTCTLARMRSTRKNTKKRSTPSGLTSPDSCTSVSGSVRTSSTASTSPPSTFATLIEPHSPTQTAVSQVTRPSRPSSALTAAPPSPQHRRGVRRALDEVLGGARRQPVQRTGDQRQRQPGAHRDGRGRGHEPRRAGDADLDGVLAVGVRHDVDDLAPEDVAPHPARRRAASAGW